MAVRLLVPFGLQRRAAKGNKTASGWSESVSLSHPPSLETLRAGLKKTLLN